MRGRWAQPALASTLIIVSVSCGSGPSFVPNSPGPSGSPDAPTSSRTPMPNATPTDTPAPGPSASATPTPPSLTPLLSPSLDPASVEAVAEAIAEGLRTGDAAGLAGLMRSPFVIGYWASEGFEREPPAAAALLLDEVGPGVGARSEVDPATVVGPDWQQMFGPTVDIEAGVVLEPWGPDGRGAAVAYFVRASDGHLIWHGIVIDRF